MNAHTISNRIRHFFHVVSNVRPIAWIGIYLCLMPIFALIYWALPEGQFRIPEGGATDFGSWLYYSIVTITTLGFGDYTPARCGAQAMTAIEVMCGIVLLGFFLNAVGSMKSEIDVESEIERQRLLREAAEKNKLLKTIPSMLSVINQFLEYSRRDRQSHTSHNRLRLLQCAARTSLCLDTIQSRIDLTQWPLLLENCFRFVADYQLFVSTDTAAHIIPADVESPQPSASPSDTATPHTHADSFLESAADVALSIESELTKILTMK
ncbi:MAG: potassium channel family protein [Muribaculaceae bacterium]|nr:potassium channel family protein [Muribaculaceae bacterium]